MARVDRAQWIELYRVLEKPLHNVVYRVIWDAHEAQDIVQETFLRCWRRRADIRADGFKALLYRTALNLASNRRRSAKLWRMVGLAAVEEVAAATSGEPIPKPVRAALDALPEEQRRVLLLTEMAGMSYAEVAAVLGIGAGTVGSRRTRALAALRDKLGDDPAPTRAAKELARER